MEELRITPILPVLFSSSKVVVIGLNLGTGFHWELK